MFVFKGFEFPGIHYKMCFNNIKEWSVKGEDLARVFDSCKICLIRMMARIRFYDRRLFEGH